VFRSANIRYRELIGGRDVVGKKVVDALPELRNQPFFIGMLNEVARTGTPYVGNATALSLDRGDGVFVDRWFDFVYQPLTDPDGSVTGITVHAVEVHAASG